MNVLNSFEMRLCIEQQLNRLDGQVFRMEGNYLQRDSNRILHQHIRDWARTRFRRWLLKQEDQFVHVHTPVCDTVMEARLNGVGTYYKTEKLLIQDVPQHKRVHALEWDYYLTLFYNTTSDNGQLQEHVAKILMKWPWQWNLLAEGNLDIWRVNTKARYLAQIIDWMLAIQEKLPRDLMRLCPGHAHEQSRLWHADLWRPTLTGQNSGRTIDPNNKGRQQRVQMLNAEVHELLDSVALDYEHIHMHHCVHTYTDDVESGRSRIFHVDLGPHKATVELSRNAMCSDYGVPDSFVNTSTVWHVVQVRGPCNAEPPTEVLDIAKQIAIWANSTVNNEQTTQQGKT